MKPDAAWLLLAFQLPPKAGALRVRVWRRLQAIGAAALKTSLYALPPRPSCREDFEWLVEEIRSGGGSATLALAPAQGRGFDATTLPEQAPPDAESGRGLLLMRALVDNVAFQSEPQAGAVVHMVKTLRFERDHPLRRQVDPPAG